MSRHPIGIGSSQSRPSTSAEAYLNFVAKSATPNALTVEAIAHDSISDTAIQAAVSCYHSNQWHTLKESNRSLWNVRDELTVTPEGLLIKEPKL